MKKILSFFTVGAAIFGTSSNFVVACNHHKSIHSATLTAAEATLTPAIKLNLNDLKIYGLDNLSRTKTTYHSYQPGKILINAHKAYLKIATIISQDYNQKFSPKKHLTANDFAFGSTKLIKDKTWALQIFNNQEKINDSKAVDLKITDTTNLANNDNSLDIQVTTSNIHVKGVTKKTKFVSKKIKGYLQDFIFNNQEANHNINITARDDQKARADHLLKKNVIDFTTGKNSLDLHLTPSLDVNHLLTQLSTKANRLTISNAIITDLNSVFNQRMKFLIKNKQAKPVAKIKNSTSLDLISNDHNRFQIFSVSKNPWDEKIWNIVKGTKLRSKQNTFIQIQVFDWNYLTNSNLKNPYLALDTTYVYGYLGDTK